MNSFYSLFDLKRQQKTWHLEFRSWFLVTSQSKEKNNRANKLRKKYFNPPKNSLLKRWSLTLIFLNSTLGIFVKSVPLAGSSKQILFRTSLDWLLNPVNSCKALFWGSISVVPSLSSMYSAVMLRESENNWNCILVENQILAARNLGSRNQVRVSVQRVKSFGSHFACLCRGLNFMK